METLARVNVLCVDKTGTITKGNFVVQDVIAEKNAGIESDKELLPYYGQG